MKNKNVVKSSLSELLPYNTRHIVCRQHHHHPHNHDHNPIALRLCAPLCRPFSTSALQSSQHQKSTALRMGRDPVLTSVASTVPSNPPHTAKPLSFLATQPNTNTYPTHKLSPQPPIAFKDSAALMGILSPASRAHRANCQIQHCRSTCEISSDSGASCLLLSIRPISKLKDVLPESELKQQISISTPSIDLYAKCRYEYLANLRYTNVHLFYKLLMSHIQVRLIFIVR